MSDDLPRMRIKPLVFTAAQLRRMEEQREEARRYNAAKAKRRRRIQAWMR